MSSPKISKTCPANHKPVRGSQCAETSGFTLVEVLVVISIIGLLLSILLPAIGRARDQANLILCRSNLKNLCLASIMYADDNHSLLPVDKDLDNPHKEVMDVLEKGNYVTDVELYYCPSEDRETLRLSPDNCSKGNISYFYYSFTDRPANRYLSNFFLKSMDWPRKLSTTMKPNMWVYSDTWFSNMPTAHKWYKKGVNFVTLDGSVNMVKESPRREFK